MDNGDRKAPTLDDDGSQDSVKGPGTTHGILALNFVLLILNGAFKIAEPIVYLPYVAILNINEIMLKKHWP